VRAVPFLASLSVLLLFSFGLMIATYTASGRIVYEARAENKWFPQSDYVVDYTLAYLQIPLYLQILAYPMGSLLSDSFDRKRFIVSVSIFCLILIVLLGLSDGFKNYDSLVVLMPLLSFFFGLAMPAFAGWFADASSTKFGTAFGIFGIVTAFMLNPFFFSLLRVIDHSINLYTALSSGGYIFGFLNIFGFAGEYYSTTAFIVSIILVVLSILLTRFFLDKKLPSALTSKVPRAYKINESSISSLKIVAFVICLTTIADSLFLGLLEWSSAVYKQYPLGEGIDFGSWPHTWSWPYWSMILPFTTLFQLPGGIVADFFKRKILMFSIVGSALVMFILFITPSSGLTLFLFLLVLMCALVGMRIPSYFSLFTSFPERHKGSVFGLMGFASGVGFIMGHELVFNTPMWRPFSKMTDGTFFVLLSLTYLSAAFLIKKLVHGNLPAQDRSNDDTGAGTIKSGDDTSH